MVTNLIESTFSITIISASGPAVLLSEASSHNSVILGENPSPNLPFAIGRGELPDREMTVSLPDLAGYGGAGADPYVVYMSPEKVLAAFKASDGEMYLAGNMGVGEEATATRWKSGTHSNMNVK